MIITGSMRYIPPIISGLPVARTQPLPLPRVIQVQPVRAASVVQSYRTEEAPPANSWTSSAVSTL
ncbi:hypothetical protein FKP32DRAFT_452307 [Trametes sanguinea]|nr:hypothetical protein FKP32DRAFT_452307 [Trametes sanguinea]